MSNKILLLLLSLLLLSTKCTTTEHRCDWTIIDDGYCDPDSGHSYCTLKCIHGHKVAIPFVCNTKVIGDKIPDEVCYISE